MCNRHGVGAKPKTVDGEAAMRYLLEAWGRIGKTL